MPARRTATCAFVLAILAIASASFARAETVNYTLDSVVLDSNNAEMDGTFSWTYEIGDFENGVGQFSFLEIPYTWHDHTDLNAVFDIGSSIEITLEGSVHDDGVDITLFLLEPLTPTSGSALDLVRSKYEIGGNGFHTGLFLSGSIVPVVTSDAGSRPSAPTRALAAYPNPCAPSTTVAYSIARPGRVRLAIHDVNGRLVTTLVDQWQPAGDHAVPWSGAGLGSGLYFVRYVAGAESGTHKLILVD